MNVVSLFAGCGGSSTGYEQAGCQVIFACDNHKDAAATYRINHPSTPFFGQDIQMLTRDMITGDVDILDGSPPCQGFSMIGDRKKDDARNFLYQEYLRLVQEIQPKVCVVENVPGMMIGEQADFWVALLFGLRRLGYITQCWKLNAWHYGVPQSRLRVIFLAYRKDLGIIPQKPAYTHTEPVTLRQALQGIRNTPEDIAWAAFQGVVTPALVRKVRPGENGSKYTKDGGGYSVYRLRWDKPAPTILHHRSGYIHPDEDRSLTLPELRRVMTFPDTYVFTGNGERSITIQIGNAVPPLFMQRIAESVLGQYDKARNTGARHANA